MLARDHTCLSAAHPRATQPSPRQRAHREQARSYIPPRSHRQAITAAGMGCQAAIKAERWLAEHEA